MSLSSGSIRFSSNLQQVSVKIRNLYKKRISDIRRTIENNLNRMCQDIRKSFREQKTGRIYKVNMYGHTILHQASAPFEAPALLTGKLDMAISYRFMYINTSSYSFYAEIGVKETPRNYSIYLEKGIGMQPRPFLYPVVLEYSGILLTELSK